MSRVERGALLHLIAGFSLWSLGFVLLYGLQALGCAYGWSNHRIWLILAFGAVLVPLAWFALRTLPGGDPANTLSIAASWANRAAFAAGILVFMPVTFATTCQ